MNQSVLFKDLLASMKKIPIQRTQEDVIIIKSYLMTIPFLRDTFKGEEQSFELLSKMFRLEIFEQDSTVFNIDSKGDKYYLILQGSVGVYIRPPKMVNKQIKNKENKVDSQKVDQVKNSSQIPKGHSINIKQQNDNDDDESNKFETRNKHLEQLSLVKQLYEGQTFGEMALIYNKPRLATIHTFSQTFLAVLTKRDFSLTIKKTEINLIKGELLFLKQIYLFQSQWTYEMLRDIYLNSEQIQLQYCQTVFKEDDPADSVYIIKKGSFQLSKKVHLSSSSSEIDGTPKKLHLQGKLGLLSECDLFGEEEFGNLVSSMFKENEKDYDKYIELSDEVLQQLINKYQNTNRYYSVTCESRHGGIVIRIKVKDFITRILSYSQTRMLLLNSIYNKIQLHSFMHSKNCETFVAYQQFLLKEQPARQINPLNNMICPNIVYSKNDEINQIEQTTNKFNFGSGRVRKDTSQIDKSLDNTQIELKSHKSTIKTQQDRQIKKEQGLSQSFFYDDNSPKQVKNDEFSPRQTQTQSTSFKRKKQKKYNFQFLSESFDNTIMEEKIPQSIKTMFKEKWKQKQEMLTIFKFDQKQRQNSEGNQQYNYTNKETQQNSYSSQFTATKGFGSNFMKQIEKLGYKSDWKNHIQNDKKSGRGIQINTPISDTLDNPMQITSYGQTWNKYINNNQPDSPFKPYNQLQSSYYNNTQNTIKIDQYVQKRMSPLKDKNLRLKPLTIIQNKEQPSLTNKKDSNKNNFNNFYNGRPFMDCSIDNSINQQINNKEVKQYQNKQQISNSSIDSATSNNRRQLRNASQDIYHPLNYYQKSKQNSRNSSSTDNNQKNALVQQIMNDYRDQYVVKNQSNIFNCTSITPVKTTQVLNTENGSINTTKRYFGSINKSNRINNKSLQKKVLLDLI